PKKRGRLRVLARGLRSCPGERVARSPTGPLRSRAISPAATRPVNGSRATRFPVPPAAPPRALRIEFRSSTKLGTSHVCLVPLSECGRRRNKGDIHGGCHHEAAPGVRSALRAPGASLESQDAPLHLHG